MQGIRVREWDGQALLNEGEYAQSPNGGTWYCCAPGNYLGNLGAHSVIEHEDGSITVSPSILISTTDHKGNRHELWHGYIERGVWRAC
jgi:hypothetical protein